MKTAAIILPWLIAWSPMLLAAPEPAIDLAALEGAFGAAERELLVPQSELDERFDAGFVKLQREIFRSGGNLDGILAIEKTWVEFRSPGFTGTEGGAR